MPKLIAKSLLVLILATVLITDPSTGGVQAEKKQISTPAPIVREVRPVPTPTFFPAPVSESLPRVWNW